MHTSLTVGTLGAVKFPRHALCWLSLCFWIFGTTTALALADGPSFRFATADQGRRQLTTVDEFVRRLSPFDRAARLKTDRDVSE